MDQELSTEAPGAEQLLQGSKVTVVATILKRHQQAAGAGGGGRQGAHVVGALGQRFVAHHVLARLKRQQRLLDVEAVGRCDHDQLDVWVGEQLVERRQPSGAGEKLLVDVA